MKIAIAFSQYGPYHHARVKALMTLEHLVVPLQIGEVSRTYAWTKNSSEVEGLRSLVKGAEEDAAFLQVFRSAWKVWREEKIEAAFLPSYAPSSSLALLLSAKLTGVKCIMMNESHAGTERARGLKKRVKKLLISLFSGAIVGGGPHRRYFKSLGIPEEKIVTGYDAIDNAYFSQAAEVTRQNADAIRKQLALPKRYLLSLGRLVEKKNLASLVEAYSAFQREDPMSDLKLVFVGSGECQDALVAQCERLNLKYTLKPMEDGGAADIYFYGFRQIDENPAFYALAEAFVLPSLYEEWGLVVNEAMACGLPVIVSHTVGSAEDLVIPGLNGYHFDPTSVADLTAKIVQLESDPESRRQMGEASLHRIQDWGCENFATQANIILDRVMA